MIKVVVFLAALGISAAGVWVIRRSRKETRLTDKRARAEVLKQLLALSDESAQAGGQKNTEKNTVEAPRAQPTPVPPMTRQQRRAEQRKAKKLAFAKSQHA